MGKRGSFHVHVRVVSTITGSGGSQDQIRAAMTASAGRWMSSSDRGRYNYRAWLSLTESGVMSLE